MKLNKSLCIVSFTLTCSGELISQAKSRAETKNAPYIVFWCANPQELRNATHITPQVWVQGDTLGKENYTAFPQDFWLQRGVTPLHWMGGYCYREKSEEEFVAYWSWAAKIGYRGIAIDEFGSGDEVVDAKMARALVKTKQANPNLFIAFWHTGPLTEILADGYRNGADLVMLETYVGDTTGFQNRFDEKARLFGIIHKTIFALGINDRAKEEEKKR